MYPNGQAGTGILQMEITTNNLQKDTVTWIGSVSSIAAISNSNSLNFNTKKLVKTFNIIGKETSNSINQVLFHLYEDGTIRKQIIKH